ncbi:MAG: hypothetical protein PVH50_01630 [Anaerolineae bacterium]|jgi:hypothetical protein
MENISQKNRTIMAALLVIAGLFMVVAAPFLVQSTLDPMLKGLNEKAAANPRYASGPTLMAIFYPLWRALIFVAGVTCVTIAYGLWKGKGWAWPVALACLAVPAAGGMYMTLPFVSFVEDAFPPSMIITLVGLAGYWGVLLLRSDRARRGIDLLVFTLLGVVATLSFIVAFGAMRQLMARPGKPMFVNAKIAGLTIGGPVSGIGAALVFAAVPLLSARKAAGWWLGLIGSASVAAANLPTFAISRSVYYLMGTVGGALLAVTLLVPGVRGYLVGMSTVAAGKAALRQELS